jgi:hypothetical protein
MSTLYQDLVALGVYISNHESDLYFESTSASREALKRYPLHAANARLFTNQVTKKPCYDVPFAYDPWWESRTGKEKP